MAKYIDADILQEKLIERLGLFEGLSSDTINPIRIDECKKIISIIDSIRQEQPEVDLEKEIERVVEKYNSLANGRRVIKPSGIEKIARHFAEWGAEHLKK